LVQERLALVLEQKVITNTVQNQKDIEDKVVNLFLIIFIINKLSCY